MSAVLDYAGLRATADYQAFLKVLYAGAKPRVLELTIPPVRVLAVGGNEPPGGPQYQEALAVLYGVAYSLKMGLRFGSLPRPAGWFDYKVGALETLWWSAGGQFEIGNAATLHWQAYLMVPPFVTPELVALARTAARKKHPETPYDLATLESVAEGHVVQVLHVGPWDAEEPAIAALHAYVADHGLAVSGRHHEIYLSDPRRTAPEKLRTVIRIPVTPGPAAQAGRGSSLTPAVP